MREGDIEGDLWKHLSHGGPSTKLELSSSDLAACPPGCFAVRLEHCAQVAVMRRLSS